MEKMIKICKIRGNELSSRKNTVFIITKYCTICRDELAPEDEFEEIGNSYKLNQRYGYDLIDDEE